MHEGSFGLAVMIDHPAQYITSDQMRFQSVSDIDFTKETAMGTLALSW